MRTPALLAVCLVLGPQGCGGDYCSRSYDKRKACASPSQRGRIPERAGFVDQCRATEKKAKSEGTHDAEFERAMVACLELEDCAAMTQCTAAAEDALLTKRHIDAIGAVDTEDIAQMKEACQYADDTNADIVAACAPIIAKLLAVSTARVTALRNAGKHDFAACTELERFAKSVGPQPERSAKVLCRETRAAANVVKALAESSANLKANKAEMPYVCGGVLKELAEISTPWAHSRQAAVAKACFEDLGLLIMQLKVPEMKYLCDFRVREIFEAVEAYGIDNAEMDGWLLQAQPLCARGPTADNATPDVSGQTPEN